MIAAAGKRYEDPIVEAVLRSCRMEIRALKPGNVSIYSEGYGMTPHDFFYSAKLIAPIIARPGLSVGERVLRSVEITRRKIGCNTNLGIILLCAPLVHAVVIPSGSKRLQDRLTEVLQSLDKRDAELVFQAIRLALPAGLGRSEHHDVHSEPTVTLREAMAVAQSWDRIAYQYANNFEDIFWSGLPRVQQYSRQWSGKTDSLEWATVGCYLDFLATIPDSHIQRKFGTEQAEWVRGKAERVEKRFKACENPYAAIPLLLQFDKELKRGGFNPGTSADLSVASLLAFHLDYLLEDVLNSRTTMDRSD